uniref:receptor-like cytosolic serine/threonine-protein kinase RBK2 n=1 Tax=Erigeron canadensis TaxID=72917 RepID=UPI001CB95184|nr:receptor-like cytosolic serine/threonine-protein kinase RBK2 [Erigeron canadensis]
MQKMKEDTYSPTCVLEDYLRSLECETVSSKESTSGSSDQDHDQKDSKKPPLSSNSSKWKDVVHLIKNKSKKCLPTSFHHSISSGLQLSKRLSSSFREKVAIIPPSPMAGMNYFKPHWKNFTFSQLQSATNNFSNENMIGKGGYAEVYKGVLKDGQLVAVKQLTRGPIDERTASYLSELGVMAHVNHPNTAKLIGYGVEGGLHLVLELSPNGSLASWLHALEEKLDWDIRYKVALGIAEGLLYLHEGCQRRIIHRDIKAANILLTKDFEPQICDFGLAKWLPEHWTHHTVSRFEGTFGYLAPEYLMHGIVDEKTDVFACGVLLLELISGRRALDYSQQSLVLWAKPLLRKNNVRELIDPAIADNCDTRQLHLMVLAASLCIQQSSIRRPDMNQVLQLLKGEPAGWEFAMNNCKRRSTIKKRYEDLFRAEFYSMISSHKSSLMD